MSTPQIIAGQEAVLGAFVRVLTPPLCELYALLMRSGVLVAESD